MTQRGPDGQQRTLLKTKLEGKHEEKVHPQHNEDAPCVHQREHCARYGSGHHLTCVGNN